MTNSIEISGLFKSYGGFSLRDVSLALPSGSIMGLIGENGAGKTTILKCLLNLVRRDAGHIALMGRDSLRQERALKQEVGVMLDECFFHDALTPQDMDRILAPIYRSWDHTLFQRYLQKFSLPEKQPLKEFSRGMKQKLSLAAALAHHPRLLLLDEPAAGLEPEDWDALLDEFLTFTKNKDRSILICSDTLSSLKKAADHITYLHQGQVVLSDHRDAILAHYGQVTCTPAQLESVDPEDLLWVRKSPHGCQGLTADRVQFQQKYPQLPVEPVTLEEVLLFLEKEAQP